MSMIATGGLDGLWTEEPIKCSIKIRDTKTGKLVATLKGHTWIVTCLAWTKDGKTLISGSLNHSIRTWNTKTWQTAELEAHSHWVRAIAISPNERILASASYDNTVLLWNLDNGQLVGLPLQHTTFVESVSFSEDGKLLATGCYVTNVYTWDVAAIVREAGLDNLLSDSQSVLHTSATQPPVQRRPPAYRVPQGFFDGVPPNRSHSSTRSRSHSTASPGSTLLSRLFHHNRNPSSAHATSPSSPLDWARNILKRRAQCDEGIQFQRPGPVVIEVPYAKGKRRNACAREKRKRLFPPKDPTASSSRPPKPNVTQPSSQPHAAVSGSSTTPDVGNATPATTSTPSHPPSHAMIRHPGLWTRFWLFIGCISHEYIDDRH